MLAYLLVHISIGLLIIGGTMKKLLVFLICLLPAFIYGAEYAAMYIVSGTTQTGSPLFLSGAHYDVTGWSSSTTSAAWSYSNNALTNTSGGGLYYVKYSISFKGSEGLWNTIIQVNSTDYATNQRRMKLNADVGNISGGSLINVSDGESIKLQVMCDNNVTSFTAYHAQVAIYEVTESLSPYYAEIYNTTAQTQSRLGTNWVDINSYSSGELNGWSFASNTLTVSPEAAGTYYALLSVSMSSANVAEFFTGISINDATPTIMAQRQVDGNADFGNSLACGIITVNGGDEVSVKVRADGSNKSFTSNTSNFLLIPLDGTSTAPYTSMMDDNNITVTTISGIWTKEENQVDFIRDGSSWSFSSATDTMSPINDSSGKYLLCYYIGLTYPNPGESGVDIDVDCSVSIGGTIVDKAIIKRSLQKKDSGDFGSANGNAIVTIDSATDVIALELKELNSLSANIKVQFSTVTLIRIKEEESFTLPLILGSFHGYAISQDEIELRWQTYSESNISNYNIYRDQFSNGFFKQQRNGNPIFADQSNTGNSYVFVDEEFEMAEVYFYWLESIDLDGLSQMYGPFYVKTDLDIDGEDTPEIVTDTSLNVYPNPFNPRTELLFSLEGDTEVDLDIYDIRGKRVHHKHFHYLKEGTHSYEWNAINESSGTYFIRMLTDEECIIKKATLLK